MTSTDPSSAFAAARDFLRREGRLLEQRLFAALFGDGSSGGVIDALRGYRNADGGFGHGLEPDKLCPASLPIDIEMALQIMATIDCADHHLILRACDFLAGSATDGAVPLAFPEIEKYPRAQHWSDWTYRPDLNPTAGIAGLLHCLGVEHPWREQASRWCWAALENALPEDAHAFGEALVFLEHAGDADRATRIAAGFEAHLSRLSHFRSDARDPSYGVTPLHLAPTPESRWRHLFSDESIAAHLDRLERDQQDDGGWSISWEPPSRAATLAYRGIETVRALRVLTAYGRITERADR